MEKILDHDSRWSLKMWTEGLVMVKEALRTGVTVDGTPMTKEERIKYEEHEVVITDYLPIIRAKIIELEEMGDIFVKAILGWMSELPEDLDNRIPKEFMRGVSTKAGEVVKIKNMEEREREKWR